MRVMYDINDRLSLKIHLLTILLFAIFIIHSLCRMTVNE